jgi:hypothetical protein
MDKNNVQLSDEELLQFRMFQEQMKRNQSQPVENVQMSDEELIQFKMFQEQMRGYRQQPAEEEVIEVHLTSKEKRKSSYVSKTLSNDEYIVSVGLLHIFAYASSFLFLAIGIFLLYVMNITSSPTGGSPYFPYQGAVAYFCLFMGFCKFLHLQMTEMVVTNKRVICKTGIISVNTEELKNTRIESVEIKQTLWQRIWGYADIYFTGTGGSYVLFTSIKNPRKVKTMLENNFVE